MAGGSHSSWRAEDLLDLERCGLAADLASTNLGSSESNAGGNASGWSQGAEVDYTYDMTEVLDNLLIDQFLPSPHNASLTTPPSHAHHHPQASSTPGGGGEQFEVILKAPTAYGIKTIQEKVTYLNRGYSYVVQLQHSTGAPRLLNSTLSLTFCDLRWRNGEREHFEQWSKDHPCDRLLEIDSIGCTGLTSVNNDESALHRVEFSWGQSSTAVLAIKINCLSTEFAAKKHGGEKGVPLKLFLEISQVDGEPLGEGGQLLYQGGCGIKVFKDKGGDRKQRQDQSKIEKLSPDEQSKFHSSDITTRFVACQLDTSSNSLSNLSSKSENISQALSGASPLLVTPPHTSAASVNPCPSHTHPSSITACCTVEDTRHWLVLHRFGQYCSLFVNFTGIDLLHLHRKDLIDLCGHADGIRLHNSLHSHTLKTLYVRLQRDKVFQAVCLEELSVHGLLVKLLEKVVRLDVQQVSSFVRVTAGGVCVQMDDTVVLTMQDEASFVLQAVKQEDGSYQLILQDHAPSEHCPSLSFSGGTSRH